MKSTASIYAKKKGGVTHVRVLIRGDVANHWASDPNARTHHAQQAIVSHKGQTVFRVRLGRWTPADPSFEFQLGGGAPGDPIGLTWQDSQGTIQTIESIVR